MHINAYIIPIQVPLPLLLPLHWLQWNMAAVGIRSIELHVLPALLSYIIIVLRGGWVSLLTLKSAPFIPPIAFHITNITYNQAIQVSCASSPQFLLCVQIYLNNSISYVKRVSCYITGLTTHCLRHYVPTSLKSFTHHHPSVCRFTNPLMLFNNIIWRF